MYLIRNSVKIRFLPINKMRFMKKKDLIEIVNVLKHAYPEAKCSLDFKSPFELLVSTILSAQCTDERVNKVTPNLFMDYDTPEKIANMDINELENIIRPCGFYKNKAKNIKAASIMIVNDFNGIVPNNMDDLIKLPGCGRKTANVVMLEAFKNPQGVAIDTHCKRLCNRLEISKESDPSKIEKDLLKLLPKEYYYDVNHTFIWHGRNCCKSQKPLCDKCPINSFCKYFKKKEKNKR